MVRWVFGVVLIACLSLVVTAQENVLVDTETDTEYVVEQFTVANFPVGMVFTPDGRLFYNEKTTGNVRVITADGETQLEPVINLDTSALQERGMLGIALSPQWEDDNTLYVVHTLNSDGRNFPTNRLVRFEVGEDNIAVEDSLEELLSLPIESGFLIHNGGNVHFDDEGYLFLSVGDYGVPANSQDLETPQGAIHRFELTVDGLGIPDDNPFEGNSIYSYGFRNPFDFTIDPLSEHLFVADVGPSCDDEINASEAGDNHGWDDNYDCLGTDGKPSDIDGYIPPMLSYGAPVIAPTGIVVYDGDAFPEWQGDLFFCNWSFGNLRRVELDETRTEAIAVHDIDLGGETCKLDLVIAPDGSLYFGTLGGGDSRIIRLRPPTDN
ncbi:MAG: PQQ-dependent sugar dehydrogenase [Chloroflexota bacterium]